MVLLWLPSRKFALPSTWCYLGVGNKALNGFIFVHSFIKIRQLVRRILGEGRPRDGSMQASLFCKNGKHRYEYFTVLPLKELTNTRLGFPKVNVKLLNIATDSLPTLHCYVPNLHLSSLSLC